MGQEACRSYRGAGVGCSSTRLERRSIKTDANPVRTKRDTLKARFKLLNQMRGDITQGTSKKKPSMKGDDFMSIFVYLHFLRPMGERHPPDPGSLAERVVGGDPSQRVVGSSHSRGAFFLQRSRPPRRSKARLIRVDS